MPEKSKLVVEMEPGKHLFMAHTGAMTHFMTADVAAGQRYYVLVRFIYGMGFQLRPIRNGGASDYSSLNPDFQEWVRDTAIAPSSSQRANRYVRQEEKVAKHREAGWQAWLRKTDAERAELGLNEDDSF